MSDDTEEETHGVEAYYSGGPGEPYYQPCISCTCRWSSGRCSSWQEAGELYDEHLAEVRK